MENGYNMLITLQASQDIFFHQCSPHDSIEAICEYILNNESTFFVNLYDCHNAYNWYSCVKGYWDTACIGPYSLRGLQHEPNNCYVWSIVGLGYGGTRG